MFTLAHPGTFAISLGLSPEPLVNASAGCPAIGPGRKALRPIEVVALCGGFVAFHHADWLVVIGGIARCDTAPRGVSNMRLTRARPLRREPQRDHLTDAYPQAPAHQPPAYEKQLRSPRL